MASEVRAWLASARDVRIAAELEAVYAEAAEETIRRGPACWASGRCCNFEKTGHLLYVTGLEAAYTVVRLSTSEKEAATGALGDMRLPVLETGKLVAATNHDGCPFQSANICTVHTIKPLGCRLYFCDRSAQDWQHEALERLHRRIRLLHDEHSIPYSYGEWRSMLALLGDEDGLTF